MAGRRPRPGRGRARRAASGSASTSARRWAASRSPRRSTSSTSSAGSRRVAPTLALAVFGGAAPANLGIALDVRGPILSTANSCASGAVALGEALNAIRDGRDRRRDRRRRRGAAVAARVRRVRHHPGAVATATTTTRRTPPGRWTRGRDGFVMGEGAALLVLEAEDVARAPRRDAVRGGARLRRDLRRPPHGPAATRRPRGGARRDARAGRRAASTPDEIDCVSAHASSTPIGDIAEARALAAARSATGRRPSRSAARRP